MLNRSRHRVSVVIPVRNEERSISRLLDTLLSQTRRPDEIVFCDAGSTDNTPAIIERYISRASHIKLVRADAAFPGKARNLAIGAARFDLLALTDAGTRLHPRWLEQLLAPFEGPRSPDVVYGRYEPMSESFCQRCITQAFVPPPDPGTGLRGPSLASMAMRRSVWTRQGGFREDLRSAEDLLFIKGVTDLGVSMRYTSRAVVFWTPPLGFAATFRRFAAYSHSNIRAGLANEWQVPLLRIYALMALLMATAWWSELGFFAPVAIMGFRAARRVIREDGIRSLFNIPLLLGVTVALAMIDLATLEGCRRWFVADWIQGGRRRPASVVR